VAAYFFDSSALVKRYVSESGSDWVLQLTEPVAENQIYVASITVVEVASALTRQAKAGHLNPADAAAALAQVRLDFANEYLSIELLFPVLQRAVALAEQYALRGYDAVQLAAALEIHLERLTFALPRLIFVSADNALNHAASGEGLFIDDPNRHAVI